MARSTCLGAALLVLLGLASTPSKAQTRSDEARAVELFEGSVEAYRRGDFASAVTLLKQAHALRPSPVLIYNLARAYEGLGDIDNAVRAYEDYVAREPRAPDRGAIEKKVATLRAQIREREALKREREDRASRPPPAAPAAPARPESSPGVAPWLVAVVGALAAMTGGAILVVAKGKHDEAREEPVQTIAEGLSEDARTLGTLGTTTAIAGSVVLATGLVWLLVTSQASPRSLNGSAPAWRLTW